MILVRDRLDLRLVLPDHLRFRLEWNVDAVVGEIEEERLVPVLLDEPRGFLDQPVREALAFTSFQRGRVELEITAGSRAGCVPPTLTSKPCFSG